MRNSLACCYFAVVRVFPFLFFFLMWTRFGRANQWAVGTGARTRAFGARTARVCGTCGVGAGGFCPSRCWSRRARVRKGEGKTGRVSLKQSSPHTPPVGACLTASPNPRREIPSKTQNSESKQRWIPRQPPTPPREEEGSPLSPDSPPDGHPDTSPISQEPPALSQQPYLSLWVPEMACR